MENSIPTATNFADLHRLVAEVEDGVHTGNTIGRFVFRGQAKMEWDLSPTGLRVIGERDRRFVDNYINALFNEWVERAVGYTEVRG